MIAGLIARTRTYNIGVKMGVHSEAINTAPRLEAGDNAGLGDGDGLLLHCLVVASQGTIESKSSAWFIIS